MFGERQGLALTPTLPQGEGVAFERQGRGLRFRTHPHAADHVSLWFEQRTA